MGNCGSSSKNQIVVPVSLENITKNNIQTLQNNSNNLLPTNSQNQVIEKTLPSPLLQPGNEAVSESKLDDNANNQKDSTSLFKSQENKFTTVFPEKAQPYKQTFQMTTNIQKPINNQSNALFQRRDKKSTTLIEKSKASTLFGEELKLSILKQSLISDPGNNPLSKYKLIKKLGEGAYGIVYLVNNILTNTRLVLKKINKVKENDELNIKNELEILKKLDHPNIVKIIEYYDTEEAFYIITEFCKKGELYGYIKQDCTEKQLAVLFYQIFSGLWYLHDHNIIHRNIKLENVLISEIEIDPVTSKLFFWVKIINFGTAKIFEKTKKESAIVGSPYYIAPEVLKQDYNEKCDTWSVGVILYLLIVGTLPFNGKNDNEIRTRISNGTYNSKHEKLLNKSPELQDLVTKLLDVNTETRLSAKEALAHPWFVKENGRYLYSNIDKNSIVRTIENLFRYTIQSKFQQLVLAFIVHNIPISDETKIINKVFRYFNKKGDCRLTKIELIEGVCQYKPKEEVDKYIEEIFILLDGDNNGYIEYEEFLMACLDKKMILRDKNLKYAFAFLDKERTQSLSAKVIMSAFVTEHNVQLEELFQNMIDEVDNDHDGNINFEEFKELMLNVS